MKLYLVKQTELQFPLELNCPMVTRATTVKPTTPISMGDDNKSWSECGILFMYKLEGHIRNSANEGLLLISLHITANSADDKTRMRVRVEDGCSSSDSIAGKGLLGRLENAEEANLLTMKLKCKKLHGKSDKEFINFSCADMKLQKATDFRRKCTFEGSVPVPASFFAIWKGSFSFTGTATISLNFLEEDKLSINRKILNDQVAADVILVAGHGGRAAEGLSCHKSFLSAHSPVFLDQLRPTCKDGMSERVTLEIRCVSEATLPSFLSYIYHWDISGAEKNCLVAFELLCAAKKYQIPRLEEEMKELLDRKNEDWFSIDVALRLFIFARTKLQDESLTNAAAKVLKCKRADRLKESPVFKTLFQENPEAAMDLCLLCIK